MSKIKHWTRSLNRPRSAYDQQRPGQALMNELCKLDEPFYKKITGTELDCFYDSTRMPETLKAWYEHVRAELLAVYIKGE